MENDILVLSCRQFAHADPLTGSQGAPGNGVVVNAKHLLSLGKSCKWKLSILCQNIPEWCMRPLAIESPCPSNSHSSGPLKSTLVTTALQAARWPAPCQSLFQQAQHVTLTDSILPPAEWPMEDHTHTTTVCLARPWSVCLGHPLTLFTLQDVVLSNICLYSITFLSH